MRQYARAVGVNVASECARGGLALPSGSKSSAGRFFDYLPKFPIQLGSLVLMLAVGLGLLALLRSVVLRKATLVVRAFADAAVEKKVGSAFGGLVEEQLIGFWQTRQRARDDGYSLDLVVANVELLAQDEALGDAVGELAQVPQLQLVAAVVAFVDRAFLQRRLSAVGELLPEGADGCGVALSLFKRKKLEARGTLWEKPAVGPSSGADGGPSAVARYYGLAPAAAAWVQYEASRVLDDRVGLITSSAESFSLLSAGIDEHRTAASMPEDKDNPEDKDKRYGEAEGKYREALKVDRENVAALVNLSLVGARRVKGSFPESIQELERARSILDRRYVESAKTRKAIPRRPELADPTWYRIRYALASQRLHAGSVAEAENDALKLFCEAEDDALELICSTSAVLTEIGWRWTGRQPTWFTSWYKRAPARLWRAVRRAAGRARRRSVVGDWELARFLAHTVEPAAVVLWWSTRIAQRSVPKTPEESDRVLRPLDRRSEKDGDWLQSYLEELVTKQPKRHEFKRVFGWLGVSRWRAPDEPYDRVDYNLACLFSRLASLDDGESRNAHLERSARHLKRCLAGEWGARRGESAHWAARDPGLRALKESNETRFEEIVGPEGEHARKPVPVTSAGHIRLRNGAIITLWMLGLAALVAIPVVMFGVPFT